MVRGVSTALSAITKSAAILGSVLVTHRRHAAEDKLDAHGLHVDLHRVEAERDSREGAAGFCRPLGETSSSEAWE